MIGLHQEIRIADSQGRKSTIHD